MLKIKTPKNIFKHLSLVLIGLVVVCIPIGYAINKNNQDVNAEDGAFDVYVTASSEEYEYHTEEWLTHMFEITPTDTEDTFVGFCAEPLVMDYPGPEFPVPAKKLNADTNNDIIKLLIHLYYSVIDDDDDAIYEMGYNLFTWLPDDYRAADGWYIYTHATIGYLFNDSKEEVGLSQDDIDHITGEGGVIDQLEDIINNSDNPMHRFWTEAQNYDLYGTDSDDDEQVIVWIQEAEIEYSISTEATDTADGDKYVEASTNASITDKITYCGRAGHTYTIQGELIDKATRETISTEQTPSKLPTDSNCTTATMPFSFDASELAGHDVVVFETLLDNGEVVASHTNLEDEDQTVTIIEPEPEYSISTEATDTADGDKFVEVSATASITDTINYCGKEGLTYTIQGVLMDKVTGEAISTVQEITSTIPAGSDCYTDTMAFSLDASELAGHDLVVFETLLYEGEEVAEHKELNDPSQTVTVISLGTTAVDGADGDKLVEASEDSQIVDTIDYCLKAGLEYTISGVLVDKATGEPITIDEETVEETITFTPSTNCGTTQMTFTLDSSELAGKAIVVYESVKYDGNTILEHQDLNDATQTVNIISLDTYALDKSDEDKEVLADEDATVTDHIKYCLVAGTEYTIIGTLMNKNTGEPIVVKDVPVQSITPLIPEENCGDLYLDFDFDAIGMGGTEIVVFEKAGITSPTQESEDDICLEHDATDPDTCTSYFHELISHADLDDVTQTVLVTTPEPEPEPEPAKPADTGRFTSASDTNTGSSNAIVIVVASATVIGAGYMSFRRFSRKRFFGKK